MAKKRREDAPAAGAPLWVATFGDLMNLLLCFFVLLFSMSTVDAQKFEMMTASFSSTFSIFSGGATSFQDGMLISNGVSQLNELDEYINSTGKAAESSELSNQLDDMESELEEEKMEASEKLSEMIEEALSENSLDKDIDVTFTSQYVQMTLKGSILFNSGEATIREDALPTVSKVAMILQRYADSTIEIEGHTDNVPIHNSKFESNDVLSSYRALAMFDYLIENTTLAPANIKHSGRGEYVPLADNSTPEGRAKNRRIEIKIYNTLSSD